jgi:argininosuccinate lyase
MVRTCLDKGTCISGLGSKELAKYSDKFGKDFKNLLNPKVSVSLKKSYGSTNPVLVNKQIINWKKKIDA